jgi:Ca-activated chloride channel family protein
MAMYYVAAGGFDAADVRRGDVRRTLCAVYSRVVHETDSVGEFLTRLYDEDQRGAALAYASAIAIEEKQAFEYNRGNPGSDYPPASKTQPGVKLGLIYPREGTLVADHPYVVLNAPWVVDDRLIRAAAFDFLRYLESDEVQRRFQAAGFRNHLGQASPEISKLYAQAQLGLELPLPAKEVLALMQSSWSDLRTCAGS